MNAVVIDEYMDALLGGSPVVETSRVAAAPAAIVDTPAGTAAVVAVAPAPVKALRPKKHKPRAVIPPALATAVLRPGTVESSTALNVEAQAPAPTVAVASPTIVAAPGAHAVPDVSEAIAPAPVMDSPRVAATIVATPLPADMITDDEFEHLLDTLHGAAAPGAVAPSTVVETPAPVAKASIVTTPLPAGMITDDEFEHLLDTLHGASAPGALALPTPAMPAAPAPAEAPRPVAPARPAPRVPSTAAQPWHPSLATTPEPKHHPATEQSSRWLHLRCSGQHYAVELLKVQEVMVPVPLLPMRGTGRAMLGVMNLRGMVVPVVDLGIRLALAPTIGLEPSCRIVVLEQNGETLGLMVSAVDDVITLRENQIEPPEHARIGRKSDPLFRGVTRQRSASSPVILLDACALLETPT
ncbi:MAG: chemotaxis protein CheW [Pseudoxanthomonas sp.]